MSRLLILTFHVLGRKGTGKQEKDTFQIYVRFISISFSLTSLKLSSHVLIHFYAAFLSIFLLLKNVITKRRKTCLPRFICFYISVLSRINFPPALKQLIANCRQICFPRFVSFSSCSSRIHFSREDKTKKGINEKQIVALPIRS